MKLNSSHEPHLLIKEFSVLAGGEWVSPLNGWTILQIRKGAGYFLHAELNQNLEVGSVVLVADGVIGRIRASQLSELSIHAFSVMPSRLAGLISLVEQSSLALAASDKKSSVQIISPDSPVALRLGQLNNGQNQEGLHFRLQLLQIFCEILRNKLDQTADSGASSAAKMRLKILLKQTPASELMEMSFDDLAQMTYCTTRHLSRIFHEVVGMSFREKRAELRLTRARELLATGNSKVVDVALESGYKSLSLFNLMFSRRYGTSPGKWRQKHGAAKKLISVSFQRGRGNNQPAVGRLG